VTHIEHASNLTEAQAMNIIFNAARGNTKRTTRTVGEFTVTFTQFADGNCHEAAARDADGVVVILANVDQFDA